MLHNVTLWVESRAANRTEKSPNITLNLYRSGQHPVLLPTTLSSPREASGPQAKTWGGFWAPGKGLDSASCFPIQHCPVTWQSLSWPPY